MVPGLIYSYTRRAFATRGNADALRVVRFPTQHMPCVCQSYALCRASQDCPVQVADALCRWCLYRYEVVDDLCRLCLYR